MLEQELYKPSAWLEASLLPEIPHSEEPLYGDELPATCGTLTNGKRRKEEEEGTVDSISQLKQAIIAITAVAANVRPQDAGASTHGNTCSAPRHRQRVQTFPFFDLPRELRNRVYHYVWKSYPSLRFPFQGTAIDLRYEGYYRMHSHESGYGSVAALRECFPEWILTSKLVFEEAVAQFVCRARWFADGCLPLRKVEGKSPKWPDTSRVSEVVVMAGNLSRVEPLATGEGRCCRESLEMMAGCMRVCHRNDMEVFRKLKVLVYSFGVPFEGCYSPCVNKIRKLVDVFHGVKILRFELEVRNRGRDRRRLLYEVRGRNLGEEMELILLEDEKHPYDQMYWMKRSQWYQTFYHH